MDDHEIISPKIWIESVSASTLYFEGEIALMQDGRILAGIITHDGVTDITSGVYSRLGKDLEDAVSEIYMYKCLLVVRAGNRVCIINVRCRQKGAVCVESRLHVFPCGINFIRFGTFHGFIRTDDGCLYMTDITRDLGPPNFQLRTNLELVDIADAYNIRDIICGLNYSLLIMDDDTVRAQGTANVSSSGKHEGIRQLELCQTEHIVNVIWRNAYVFYITVQGSCYYSYVLGHLRRNSYKDPCPVLFQSLSGLFVENVFITHRNVIVQYSDTNIAGQSKLCLLSIDASGYINGTETPIPLPFFDDKRIINVAHMYYYVYFTTTEGFVYKARDDRLAHTLIAERIEFFDDNPVAVESTGLRLASTRSCLDD